MSKANDQSTRAVLLFSPTQSLGDVMGLTVLTSIRAVDRDMSNDRLVA